MPAVEYKCERLNFDNVKILLLFLELLIIEHDYIYDCCIDKSLKTINSKIL